MKKVLPFLSACWRDTHRSHRYSILLMFCFLLASLCLALQLGCSTTAAGLSREQKLYQTGTNIVGMVDKLAPALPPPFSSVAEGATALAAAGLAAWNAWQHKAIKGLQNGQGIAAAAKASADAFAAGHAAGYAAAAKSPPLSAQPTAPS